MRKSYSVKNNHISTSLLDYFFCFVNNKPEVALLILLPIENRPDFDRAKELCKFRCSVRIVAAFNTLLLIRSQYHDRSDIAQRHFNLASFSLVEPRSVETLVICFVHAVVCLTN